MQNNNLLTPSDAAILLGISPQTLAVWRSTNRYRLQYIRVGRLIRYRQIDIENFILSRSMDHTKKRGVAA